MIKVCKTFIRRFDPDPRLQPKHPKNHQISVSGRGLRAIRGVRILRAKTANGQRNAEHRPISVRPGRFPSEFVSGKGGV